VKIDRSGNFADRPRRWPNMNVQKSPLESLPRSACAEIVKKFSVWLTAYLPRLPKVRAEMVKAATALSSRRCSFVRVGA
ncbi:MAG: hypothetical protein AAAC47_19895, partial [Pararhizobium sp.]